MKNFVIVLDGPKGSGKTTLCDLLKKKLSNTHFFSLDEIRRAIPNARATDEYNQMAFDILLQELTQCIKNGNNIVIDCGLTEQKLLALEKTVRGLNVDLYKYALVAPLDILLERVKERDRKSGKETDEKRFQEVYQILQSKDFSGYVILDTESLSPDEIVNKILFSLEKFTL